METFSMSRKEVPRAGLLKAALVGRIKNAQGARALRLSVRQFRRVKRRFREGGARGLRHALRGRPGNRRAARPAREQVLVLMTTTYAGCNDVHRTQNARERQQPYGDRLNVFARNDPHWTLAEELQGHQDPTHFGRMLQALGIGFIRAHSPQAKGRIERLWGTLQDRLTSELRLRGISTLEGGNAFLPEFLADFTRRFARPPADATPAWRPVPRDLADLLSCRYHRTVARDNTVHLGARWVQIPRGPRGRSYAGCHVQVHERLDGHLRVVYHDTVIASQPSPDPAFVLKPREGPGQVRRGPQRGTLRHALGELGRAPLTQARAVSPSRPP